MLFLAAITCSAGCIFQGSQDAHKSNIETFSYLPPSTFSRTIRHQGSQKIKPQLFREAPKNNTLALATATTLGSNALLFEDASHFHKMLYCKLNTATAN